MDILLSTHKTPAALSLLDMYALLLKFTCPEIPKADAGSERWKVKVVSHLELDKIIFNCINRHKRLEYYADSDRSTLDFILSLCDHETDLEWKSKSRPVEVVINKLREQQPTLSRNYRLRELLVGYYQRCNSIQA